MQNQSLAEQFHQFKSDFFNKFNEFKTKFLPKVKSFKDSILNIAPRNTESQEKNKVIESLINQFSQQNNYLFQKRNTDSQLDTDLESVKSKETVKNKKREKIKTT